MSSGAPSNWSGNIEYQCRYYHSPESVEELQRLVARATKVRVIGTRHSFSTCADPADAEHGELISLAKLPLEFEVDDGAWTVTCSSHMTCGELASRLHAQGWALHNMASLPHISIGGAVATATHGSGDGNGNLLSAVVGVAYVDADGALSCCDGELPSVGERHDSSLNALLLGACGVVTELTMRVQRSFEVRQDVYLDLPWAQVEEQLYIDRIFADAYSVSLFTDWNSAAILQAWFKRKVPNPRDDGAGSGTALTPAPAELFGGTLARKAMHPIRSQSASACTAQGEPPGPWHERLPHFSADDEPSARGDELQSEYFIPREHAAAAAQAVHAIGPELRTALKVSELRSIASDLFWLSPCYRRPSIGFHFTWTRDEIVVKDALRLLEATLAPFAPRPHWGKIFLYGPLVVMATYPRLNSYNALIRHLDPKGKFRNAFLQRLVDTLLHGRLEPGGEGQHQDETSPTTKAAAKARAEAAGDSAPFPGLGWELRGVTPRPYDLGKTGLVLGEARDGDA